MTATSKQKRCILALSKELGDKKRSWDDLEGLSIEDASEMIDKLRDKIDNGGAIHKPEQRRDDINGATFGMCFKLVYDGWSSMNVFVDKSRFKKKVAQLYRLAEATKRFISNEDDFNIEVSSEEVVM